MNSCSKRKVCFSLTVMLLILTYLPSEAFFASNRLRHKLEEKKGTKSSACETIDVVLPGQPFRETQFGELSVCSFNMLAPFYHSLGVADLAIRESFAEKDRLERLPSALEMAKRSNADILLLQEVEGGSNFEPKLKELLRDSTSTSCPGYDMHIWAPLLPNKPDHPVGVCVAWRSKKHRLISSDGFKRGIACQMEALDGGGTFALTNVHLPARPSNIMGRLVTMSKCVQRLASYNVVQRSAPLDGLLLIGGDWNCDHKSVAGRLLTDGRVNHGNVRDRNYKTNISKAASSQMRHGYRFRDIYNDEIRKKYVPVTVSLHGRGPGSMDHLFFTQPLKGSPKQQSNNNVVKMKKLKSSRRGNVAQSKRKLRREKATRMSRASSGLTNDKNNGCFQDNVIVESVLATLSHENDEKRFEIICNGLPNLQAGFPSDHLPIGALFVPRPKFCEEVSTDVKVIIDDEHSGGSTQNDLRRSGVSSSVQRRRNNGYSSMSVRRRHNNVLRYIAEWLEKEGATEVVRDQPLYKNKYMKDAKNLTKKSRAPDIVCLVGQSLVVVEVTVVAASKVEAVAEQKRKKYKDLSSELQKEHVRDTYNLAIEEPCIIVLGDNGIVPDSTKQSLRVLASLLHPQKCEDDMMQKLIVALGRLI